MPVRLASHQEQHAFLPIVHTNNKNAVTGVEYSGGDVIKVDKVNDATHQTSSDFAVAEE